MAVFVGLIVPDTETFPAASTAALDAQLPAPDTSSRGLHVVPPSALIRITQAEGFTVAFRVFGCSIIRLALGPRGRGKRQDDQHR